MVYTITFNPSLDYILNVSELKVGATNESGLETIFAGGDGLNVSMVLNELGVDNTAVSYVGGFTGEEIKRQMTDNEVNCRFIDLPNCESKINVVVKGKRETKINAAGPKIDKEKLKELWDVIEEIEPGDMLVLSGAIPSTLPQNIYADIMKEVAYRRIKVVVDTTGNTLQNLLNLKPFLVKPNKEELYQLFGVNVTTLGEARSYAKKMKDMGAVNAMISLGKVGAILAAEDGKIYQVEAPTGNNVNSVGAGDSMVAGFITGVLAELKYEEVLKLAVAAGSATAFSPKLATQREIQELYERL